VHQHQLFYLFDVSLNINACVKIEKLMFFNSMLDKATPGIRIGGKEFSTITFKYLSETMLYIGTPGNLNIFSNCLTGSFSTSLFPNPPKKNFVSGRSSLSN
jgi:hypothetical protein